jgi:hypothetical protein
MKQVESSQILYVEMVREIAPQFGCDEEVKAQHDMAAVTKLDFARARSRTSASRSRSSSPAVSRPNGADMAGAAKALLRVPKARGFEEPKPGEQTPHPKGARYAEATLEPPVLQDLVDALPDVLKAAAGIPLSFHVRISIADNPNLTPTTIDTISKLLEEVSSDLRLKT